MKKILISGSIAYDRIMDFPGKFNEHILTDKISNINVCFMISDLKENFGGTAGNIAYTLSLLGERPDIIATAGRDFASYREWLLKHNIPLDHIKVLDTELTAGAYITTDDSDNQITVFNPGAMKHSADYDFDTLKPDETIAIVSPGNLDDMRNFSKIYKDKGIGYIFDPGQSLPAWEGIQLKDMINGSGIFISNDYELSLTLEKTEMSLDDILELTGMLITTKGEKGATILYNENGARETIEIPPVKIKKVLDPTGAGDSFRGGLIKGLLLSAGDIAHAGKLGALAAAYSVEADGPQNFEFSMESFNKRFKSVFGGDAFPI